MADAFTIINARLPGYTGLQKISVNPAGIIQAIAPMSSTRPEQVGVVQDVQGDWLSPGGVDVQINGALGLAFPDVRLAHVEQLHQIAEFLWEQGVDAFLPTLVTTSFENIHGALGAIATYQAQAQSSTNAAQVLGVHLEGPFLNPQKRGAHPEDYLRPLTLDQVKQVLGDHASTVRVMTLAPELDPTASVIPYLRKLGIIVSLGHSQATAVQAIHAFDQGATMVTHAFNAMPSLHHREPGLLGAALTYPGVMCGVIADGVHVAPGMLDVLIRIGRGDPTQPTIPNHLFLVSDALAPLGLPDGRYPWDSREIEVTQGTARLLDGTLSGTTLPLLVGAQRLVEWQICSPEEAIALATIAPRQAMGLPGLEPGQPCPRLRWQSQDASATLNWQLFSS
jgi:N-acetylglucosamine-6-phosphate deacetylase